MVQDLLHDPVSLPFLALMVGSAPDTKKAERELIERASSEILRNMREQIKAELAYLIEAHKFAMFQKRLADSVGIAQQIAAATIDLRDVNEILTVRAWPYWKSQ